MCLLIGTIFKIIFISLTVGTTVGAGIVWLLWSKSDKTITVKTNQDDIYKGC